MFIQIESLIFKNFSKKKFSKFFNSFIFFFFFTNLVELFGLYLILPVAYFIIGEKSELINFSFLNNFNIDPINIVYLFFFFIYILKLIFSIFSYWFQYYKIYQIQKSIINFTFK